MDNSKKLVMVLFRLGKCEGGQGKMSQSLSDSSQAECEMTTTDTDGSCNLVCSNSTIKCDTNDQVTPSESVLRLAMSEENYGSSQSTHVDSNKVQPGNSENIFHRNLSCTDECRPSVINDQITPSESVLRLEMPENNHRSAQSTQVEPKQVPYDDSENISNRNPSGMTPQNAEFALQLIQKCVRSTYIELEKNHVDLTNKLMASQTKCEKLEDELEVLQKKHAEDVQLISKIEFHALQIYESHANEVKNYESVISELQSQVESHSVQGSLANFYKSQNEQLLKENASLCVELSAVKNEVKNYESVISELQSQVESRSVQDGLVNFYKSQSEKLLKENASLRVEISAVKSGSENALEILSENDHAIHVRPIGQKT